MKPKSHELAPSTRAPESAECPRCTHDNSHVVFPTYSKMRARLGMKQAKPKCDVAYEDASGFASPGSCGCTNDFHAQI